MSISIPHKFTFTNNDLKHKIEYRIPFFIIQENYNNIKTGYNRITDKEMNLYKQNVGFVFGVCPYKRHDPYACKTENGIRFTKSNLVIFSVPYFLISSLMNQ